MVAARELDAFFERVPEHVLTVLDEAYFEYVDDAGLPGRDRRVLEARAPGASSCARSRRSTGSPGCASATASGPRTSSPRSARCANAFDIDQTAQDAALASLGDAEELARRRALTAAGRERLVGICAELGLEVALPAVANFVYADSAARRRRSSTRCFARASSCGRSRPSARPRRSASRSAPRRRTSSSAPPWPACSRPFRTSPTAAGRAGTVGRCQRAATEPFWDRCAAAGISGSSSYLRSRRGSARGSRTSRSSWTSPTDA